MLKHILLGCTFLLLSLSISAQTTELVGGSSFEFAMPILIVSPDARAAGMGDMGVATFPSISAQNWNAAKYIFMEPSAGLSFSYVPWLRNIGPTNINLLYLTGYYKFAKNQSIGASFRYFSLGDISFMTQTGDYVQTSNPNEFAVDVSYALQLGESFSASVAFRYLRSDLTGGFSDPQSVSISPANGFSGDIGFYYQQIPNSRSGFTAGFGVSNIGTKMNYDYSSADVNYFLPNTMRLGGGYGLDIDHNNNVSFNIELSKFLVPTRPDLSGMTDDEKQAANEAHNNTSSISGMFKSFSDAPGGFKEELREIMLGLGVEYTYADFFNGRTGFFYDHKNVNHRYFTVGAGFRYQSFKVDLSYLIPVTSGFQNPLANTIHLTLSVNLDRAQ